MAQLFHKNDQILSDMVYATSILQISKGLMFAGKKKINKGMCLVIPSKMDERINSSVTMLFCFYSMDIIFVDSNFNVVDKQTLRPFKVCYVPKKKCRYVIESFKGKFNNIKIGDKIEIHL